MTTRQKQATKELEDLKYSFPYELGKVATDVQYEFVKFLAKFVDDNNNLLGTDFNEKYPSYLLGLQARDAKQLVENKPLKRAKKAKGTK
jgi:hypothetical protein